MTRPTPTRALLAATLALGAAALATQASAATSYTITTYAMPNAVQTNPVAIGADGTVIGNWVTSKYVRQGYVYAGGKISSLVYPQAAATYPQAINKSDTIAGTYIDSNGNAHGFTYAGGTFSSIDLPGSTFTAISGINNAGALVGAGTDSAGNTELFTYSAGKFTTIVDNGLLPVAVGINDAGEVAGWYEKDPTYETAFRYANGTILTPKLHTKVFYTQSFGMNKYGVMVGQAADTSGHEAGFIMGAKGPAYTPALPGSTDWFFLGINDSNVMVGASYDANKIASAFVYSKGTFTTLNVSAPNLIETHGIGINDAGTVMGDYVDKTGTKGFVAVPAN